MLKSLNVIYVKYYSAINDMCTRQEEREKWLLITQDNELQIL